MMMFNRPDGSRFMVDVMSLGLNLAAYIALIASFQDGMNALIVAILIWILDELRHPNPIVMDVIEEPEDPPKDNGPESPA